MVTSSDDIISPISPKTILQSRSKQNSQVCEHLGHLEITACFTDLRPPVRQPLHDLRGSIERTSTVGLQQRALLEIIREAKISQLQRKGEHELTYFDNNYLYSFLALTLFNAFTAAGAYDASSACISVLICLCQVNKRVHVTLSLSRRCHSHRHSCRITKQQSSVRMSPHI